MFLYFSLLKENVHRTHKEVFYEYLRRLCTLHCTYHTPRKIILILFPILLLKHSFHVRLLQTFKNIYVTNITYKINFQMKDFLSLIVTFKKDRKFFWVASLA